MERSLLRDTWIELKRRRVVRAGVGYVVVAWVVLQVAEINFEPLGLPAWALTWTVLGAVLGFPVALALSWFFDVSRRGVSRERGATGAAGAAFGVAVVVLAVAGVAWWLYGVYAPSRLQPAETTAAADTNEHTAPPNSIGVLPFDDLSPDKDQGYLADGIAEELLDRLARNAGLKVASRTSSFALRGRAQDLRVLGRQLGVRWVLEGSLRKANERIRVTAQLIDASTGFHVWSETYERPGRDLFALQDEVAVAIADELSSRIEGVTAEAPAQADTTNPEALQAYLQGRQAWRKRTAASLQQAETMFLKAVELDPEFARAWCGLADTYLLQADYGGRSGDEAILLAEPAAVKAVVLRPQLGEAWASLGLLRMNAGQYRAAQSSLEQAMELDPRYEMAPMWLASVYARIGRVDLQREVLRKAAELNPLEPVININLAELLVNTGDTEGARSLLQRVLAITPNDATLLRGISNVELGQGNHVASLRAARLALATDPEGPANLHTMLNVLMGMEDFETAVALANRLPEGSLDRQEMLQWIAFRSGESETLPGFAALIPQIEAQAHSGSRNNALTLAGMVALRAGNTARAIALLSQLAEAPEQLEGNHDLLDAASLLAFALEKQGEAAQAKRWEQPLLEIAEGAIQHTGNGVRRHMIEAMVAMHRRDTQAAMTALNLAYERGYRERWQLLYDPRLAPLQSQPEMQALAQRIADELTAARKEAASVRIN